MLRSFSGGALRRGVSGSRQNRCRRRIGALGIFCYGACCICRLGTSLGRSPVALRLPSPNRWTNWCAGFPRPFEALQERIELVSGARNFSTVSRIFPCVFRKRDGGPLGGLLDVRRAGQFCHNPSSSGFMERSDPQVYRRGLTCSWYLRSVIARAGVAGDGQHASRGGDWLTAQFIAMTVVGVLTALGLWIAGVPSPLRSELIAGLLAFHSEYRSGARDHASACCWHFSEGQSTVIAVLAIYLGVETLESYLVISRCSSRRRSSLPPALVIAVQLLFGVLFGILVLALARRSPLRS